MSDLTAGIDQVVAALKQLQFRNRPLRVETRLEDVNPPCAWVALESIDHLSAVAEQTLRVFLVAGDVDEYRAIKTLSPLLEQVLGVISPTEATTVVGLGIPGQQQSLPALRVTTTSVI